jgi:hypothetical protein
MELALTLACRPDITVGRERKDQLSVAAERHNGSDD